MSWIKNSGLGSWEQFEQEESQETRDRTIVRNFCMRLVISFILSRVTIWKHKKDRRGSSVSQISFLHSNVDPELPCKFAVCSSYHFRIYLMSPSQIVYSIVALENTKKKKKMKKNYMVAASGLKEKVQKCQVLFLSQTYASRIIQNELDETQKKRKKKSCLRLRFSSLEGDRNGKWLTLNPRSLCLVWIKE